mmetsp:Transcript_20210/g.17400  ORF Transcript_20210/g.17400 Transcript_20210/m.17400 type:complete len:198 (+) Transcript_20210:571-1164(+)
MLPSLSPGGEEPAPDTTKVILKMEEADAKYNLANPQFMDIKVKIHTPIITIKPTPSSNEWIEVRLGDLEVRSDRLKNTDRYSNPKLPLDFVYCEVFKIDLNNMGLFKVIGDNRSELSKKFTFNMSFERLLFETEYKTLYDDGKDGKPGKFSLDEAQVLTGYMTPIIMILYHEDFLFLMKVLNFNIAYDDRMDQMFLA